jgi:hypothetical protein
VVATSGRARWAAGYRAQYDGGWEDELNIRTQYPAHRAVPADGTAGPLASAW